MPAGTSVAVKIKADKAASWIDLKTADGNTTFTTTDATEAVFLADIKAKILEIGITLTPNVNTSPEVLAIITYLEKETFNY